MKKLTESTIATAIANAKPLPVKRLQESSLLIPRTPPDLDRVKAITEIILQVEMAKQLSRPLSDQERNVLMRLLADTGDSIEAIKQRARMLLTRKTFGNIAFEHWMTDEVSDIKGRFDCSYCGTEWWGPPKSKCPTCFTNGI